MPTSRNHSWKRFKAMEEAEQTAFIARKAKNQTKVAYSRRNASRKNISRARKPCPVPGMETMPETAKSPGMETMPTGPGTETMPTPDISGGGGAEGGQYPISPEPGLRQPVPQQDVDQLVREVLQNLWPSGGWVRGPPA